LLSHVAPLSSAPKAVATFDADGRVLAEDLVFRSSGAAAGQLVDGRLCGAAGIDVHEKGVVLAGVATHTGRPRRRAASKPGTCARIFTGAPDAQKVRTRW
jgi:molybdopterin biosynthesis enzyme